MQSRDTSLDDTRHLISDARSLIQQVVRNTDDTYGFGTLSCSVYDTAWVALVSKSIDGKKRWLFPESFQYILNTQSDDGSWAGDSGAQIDGVLNTIAALLVLKRYREQPLQVELDGNSLDSRIIRAVSSLRCRLTAWDVSTTNNVGFEIIVPAMLDLLEKVDTSLVFEFRGRKALMGTYHAKMSRFKPEVLYGTALMTATHSLEAFIGKINFDKVAHHKVFGSMFASPSSTAAYLMNASIWDDEAEAYLRYVIRGSTGQGGGGVPGVFPTTHFEYTWILSTLIRAGFSPSELESAGLAKMTDILTNAFEMGKGAIGLAPGIEPDVDDSAKVVITLNMIGRSVPLERFIELFEVATHFRVYPGERDPSFSANCNVLAAFLRQPEMSRYSTQIAKIVKFLCNLKWNSDDEIKDKWNTSHLYSSLLYVEALVDLLVLIEQDKFPGVFDQQLLSRVSITLFHACLRPLLDQESDGSWNKSIEETAYAILILTEARRLCFFDDIHQPLQAAVERGIAFITSLDTHPLRYTWSDKVSYGSASITEAYVLAARKSSSSQVVGSVGSSIWHDKLPTHVYERVKLFLPTNLATQLPEWELRASLIEATLFLPLLKDPRLEIFPRQDVQSGNCFIMIAFTWTCCNNRNRTHASASFLYEMTVLAFITYEFGQFMGAVAGPAFNSRMDELRQLVDVVMADRNGQLNGIIHDSDVNGSHRLHLEDENLINPLSQFVSFILENSVVQSASSYDRKALKQELWGFLRACMTRVEDTLQFGEELKQKKTFTPATGTYFRWVRNISASHITGPLCFTFAVCLIGATLTPASCRECFPTPHEKYLAAATCHHLSIMCRMYNDIGTWTRDRDEGNLNSIHFPEFSGEASDDGTKKTVLLRLAQYERNCWNDAVRRLVEEPLDALDAEVARLSGRRIRIIQMFCDAAHLHAQSDILKDFSTL